MSNLKILSLNVRGLCNAGKRKAIFSYLKMKRLLYSVCKKLSQLKMMKKYGLHNGVGKFFFLMAQSAPEVYVLW